MPYSLYVTWLACSCFAIGFVLFDACDQRTLPRFIISSFHAIRLAIWRDFCATASGLIAVLASIEPLTPSTNRQLFALGCGIWAYAIGISWWGDNRAYMAGGFEVLALTFLYIFATAEQIKTS